MFKLKEDDHSKFKVAETGQALIQEKFELLEAANSPELALDFMHGSINKITSAIERFNSDLDAEKFKEAVSALFLVYRDYMNFIEHLTEDKFSKSYSSDKANAKLKMRKNVRTFIMLGLRTRSSEEELSTGDVRKLLKLSETHLRLYYNCIIYLFLLIMNF